MMVDNRSVDYLLGAMPERERDEFEHEYFSNPSVFERVARAESELLDAYARGRLSPEDRERVERVYRSDPRRRERLYFAKALAAAADADASAAGAGRSRAGQWTGWRLAAAVAAALVAAVTAVLSIETVRLRRDLANQAAARVNAEHALETQLAAERARNDQLRSDLDRARAAGSGAAGGDRTAARSTVLALTLFGSGRRTIDAGSIPTLVVPPGTEQIRLELVVDASDYRSYQLRLRRADGVEVLAQDNATARVDRNRATFALLAPASQLSSGDYLLTLRGILPAGEADDITQSRLRIVHR
jgi:hypothetical protein